MSDSTPQSVDQRTLGAPVVSLAMPRMRREVGRLKNLPVAGEKKVLLAAPRGYCAGVDRAVVAVEKALERFGAPVYVRKQIVHNVHVVRTLEKMGAIFVEEVDEVPEGAHVVFSAHGVSPAVVAAASDRGLQAIDATCPLVTKVHREAVRFARDDFEILLIGHDGHEEVEGTAGEAPDHVTVVNNPDEADTVIVKDPSKVVWLSQTTLSVDETIETVDRLRARLPMLVDPPSDDICYATQNRQDAVKKLAAHADVVFVVGSRSSSNSNRLRELAENLPHISPMKPQHVQLLQKLANDELEAAQHIEWVQAKVAASRADIRPRLTSEEVDAKMQAFFASLGRD